MPNPVVEAKSVAARLLFLLNGTAAPLRRRTRLALVMGLGLMLCAILETADGCIIPNGWDDAPYVEYGKQHQTNLLSLRIFGTDPATGEIRYIANASAAYLNSRFALCAAHEFEVFPDGSQIVGVEVATGNSTLTNRGVVMGIPKYIFHPGHIRGNDGTPDLVILCLASNLPGPNVTIAGANSGDVVTHAGFGDHGTAATGTSYDKNSRAWDAPVDSEVGSQYNPEFYRQSKFYPYIPMNAKGYVKDSGGPVMRQGDKNVLVGLTKGGDLGVTESGFTVYVNLSHPTIKSWIDQNTSLTPSFSIDADKRVWLTGNTNLLYGIEASTNLVNWQEIGVVNNLTGTASFQDTNSANYSHRFYRAVVR